MYKAKVNEIHNFELNLVKDCFQLEGKDLEVDIHHLKEGQTHFIYQNKSYTAEIVAENSEEKSMTVKVNGKLCQVNMEDQFDILLKEMGMGASAGKTTLIIKAPMPGLVLSVSAVVGQEIKKGDSLLVLEAMKMENMLKSTTEGVIKKIYVGKGDKVEKNQVLIEFL